MNIIIKNINRILKEQNRTIYWLTQQCNFNKSYINGLQEGTKKDISLLKAKKIADVLNVSLDELVK